MTTEPALEVHETPEASPRWRFWRRRLSIRTRLLGWYIAFTVLALVAGLLVQRSLLLQQLDDEVNAQLAQEVEEVRQLSGGLNPTSGEPFAGDVRAIFDTFLSRNFPVEGEALFTLVEGRPYASTPARLQLLDDPVLVEDWARLTASAGEEISTDAGPVRYLAAPLTFQGEVRGTFVVAYFLEDRLAEVEQVIRTGALVFGSVVLVAVVLAWFAAGQVLRPIRDLTAAARSINDANWADRIQVEGDDEIAYLARTFNDMLDRLEAAFEAQRRLIDDAGHELRTPITIIRGHLELLSEDEVEREETLRLVGDELGRMARIVEDLLLLAKSEQADFLYLHPVDLDELTADIVAKASALDDREWLLEERGVGVVIADEQRLTQAVMNLARNAVEHTPPGTPVRIGSRLEGGAYSIWVADAGEGIPLAEQPRIFERFSRGSAARRSEGAGLGLAIVSVIAEAHGGQVRLVSEPGKGATFTITLPVDPDGAEAP